MYGGVQGKDPVLDFLGQTGTDALKGADILRTAPQQYTSTIEYASNPIAQSLRSVAQVLLADFGTRVFYTQHGSFDTHSGELISHAKLWDEVSSGIGSGTDHGSGGVAFIIGSEIKGGMYGQYPSIKEADQLEGDLHFNNDFRSTYSTIIENWFGMDAVPIVNGSFEKFDFVSN